MWIFHLRDVRRRWEVQSAFFILEIACQRPFDERNLKKSGYIRGCLILFQLKITLGDSHDGGLKEDSCGIGMSGVYVWQTSSPPVRLTSQPTYTASPAHRTNPRTSQRRRYRPLSPVSGRVQGPHGFEAPGGPKGRLELDIIRNGRS